MTASSDGSPSTTRPTTAVSPIAIATGIPSRSSPISPTNTATVVIAAASGRRSLFAPTRLDQLEEFSHVVLAGVGRDTLPGRSHQCAERGKIRLGDGYSLRLEFGDLPGLGVGSQLAHQCAGRLAFLTQDLLLLRREFRETLRVDDVDGVVVGV